MQHLFILLIAIATFLSVATRKLSLTGGITGGAIALAIYFGSGWVGVVMLGAFFVLGTLATSLGKRDKEKIGLDDNHGGQRTAAQVIANGGVAALCCMLTFMDVTYKTLYIMLAAAALSSAMADTLSSELGTLYGKRFYNILTFRKDTRGENGVVSLEGTLIGIGGSCIIAAIFAIGITPGMFWIIVIAGTAGNIVDSILGATLERRQIIKNNAVNLLNTIVAALTALLLFFFFI